MEIKNVSHLTKGIEFEVFKAAEEKGNSVRGICAEGGASFTRKQQDALQDYVKTFKAKGLMFISLGENGEIKSTISKFLTDEQLKAIADVFGAKNGDLVCLCAGRDNIVLDALGNLRGEVARKLDIIPKGIYKFLWVTEMPLLEPDEETGKMNAVHHPFTSPMDEDMGKFETDPANMRAKAYDIVLNGLELGGGSIRIHQPNIQRQMFRALGLAEEDIDMRFGHMLEAFKYGAPPHGGIALGIDRIVMLMVGADNIREVIAFPKTKDAQCLLTNAPGNVSEKQLNDLGIRLK